MGLLDDAIREHLELKRRHGADPGEVERQEQEALGPARRGAAATEDPAVLADEPLDDELLDDEPLDDDEGLDIEEPEAAIPAAEPEAPVAPPAAEPEERFAEDAAIEDSPLDREAAAEDADAEAPREDVLEETPDFLQETPEHDRLWFEQKPPRDFEF